MSRWYRTEAGGSQRTSNPAEAEVFTRLERQGYTIIKNGWPDAVAVHPDGTIRFIEVKARGGRHLSPRQERMANALRKYLNIEVEILHP